jgi:hypothetical protein
MLRSPRKMPPCIPRLCRFVGMPEFLLRSMHSLFLSMTDSPFLPSISELRLETYSYRLIWLD